MVLYDKCKPTCVEPTCVLQVNPICRPYFPTGTTFTSAEGTRSLIIISSTTMVVIKSGSHQARFGPIVQGLTKDMEGYYLGCVTTSSVFI
jgi:hypothetical protein